MEALEKAVGVVDYNLSCRLMIDGRNISHEVGIKLSGYIIWCQITIINNNSRYNIINPIKIIQQY